MALHGFGLRTTHYAQLLEQPFPAPLVEAISENFMDRGGRPLAVLERVRRDAQVVLHGVSLSIGGVDPLRRETLESLKTLRRRVEALWVSDHLCFGTVGGHVGHDLWPMPFTEEAVHHTAARIRQVQDTLGEQFVIENVSSYVQYAASAMPEWEFVRAIAEEADCGLLVDVNNIVVNAHNHGFDAKAYVRALPGERIRQLHLAGHTDYGTHRFDDHGSAVPDEVLALYQELVRVHGPKPAIVEWDEHVPALEVLVAESRRMQAAEAQVLAERTP